METQFLLKGLAIGFAVAATVGPISLLCVQRTLRRGWAVGWVSGLGVASADALYGFVGGLGLSLVTDFLVEKQAWLRLSGGGVLVYIGLKTLLAPADGFRARPEPPGAAGFLGAYSSVFFLTLSNPLTILFFAAVYVGIGRLGLEGALLPAGLFGAGIFLGSACWWLLLTGGVNLVRQRFRPQSLAWLNRLAGLAIAGFGVGILVGLV